MPKKIIWTIELETTLLDACAELGCEWQLIAEIYFPNIDYYSLKNKYYKIIKSLKPFNQLPTFQHITPSTLPTVLIYNFQDKKTLLPKQNLIVTDQLFYWNYPQFDDSDYGEYDNFL
ncbi:Myb-like DNA-binding domain-containing protein [Spironucleus salmonicida]|uniref:Myb-like DNA-binding domain-containing protein n=1 Tax=Spironucleus salmonicida TaxID=348837 RepID=V6LYR4_9EUKA|nr:Myb-like DNA-binding domain-containing protein [Spironucleus salmonicida]|eukprot:EST48871.1 Myb-like DNA-binding domain-containing protein [Spironucleus salmonicida]